jgi:phytoene dehydrogenase-like protein
MLFIAFAVPQASYLLGGGHYIRGGSQALTDQLVTLIQQAGGVLESGREARQVLMEGERVAGIVHGSRNGGDLRKETASAVFGNASPNALAEMLPEERRASFMAPYASREQSISLWTVSLGLGRPAREFGVRRYSTFILPPWITNLSQMREASAIMGEQPGRRMPPYVLVDYSQIDSGLNKTAPFLATLCGIDRVENWLTLGSEPKKDRKARWIDALIADIDRQFPGLAGAVVHREIATSETMQHYLNTPGGSVYGFAPVGTLGQLMRRAPRTSIDGLWLASAYTVAGGYTGAMLGGAQAASAALGVARSRRS